MSTIIRVIGISIAFFLITPSWGGDTSARKDWSGPVEPTIENPDFPLLPSVPGGLSVPLPPQGGIQSDPGRGLPASLGHPVRGVEKRHAGMITIPAGPFEMGSEEEEASWDERPMHRVYLRQFHIAEREVTVREYCDFLNKTGLFSPQGIARVLLDSPDCPIIRKGKTFSPKDGYADRPMVCVSWYGATEFAQWSGGRLPTAAEWEKAAAVMGQAAPPGDRNFNNRNAECQKHRLPDRNFSFHGRVWEWCADWYAADFYRNSPSENPVGPPMGQEKELRGGPAVHGERVHRIQNRHKAFPDGYYKTVGFRIVRD